MNGELDWILWMKGNNIHFDVHQDRVEGTKRMQQMKGGIGGSNLGSKVRVGNATITIGSRNDMEEMDDMENR